MAASKIFFSVQCHTFFNIAYAYALAWYLGHVLLESIASCLKSVLINSAWSRGEGEGVLTPFFPKRDCFNIDQNCKDIGNWHTQFTRVVSQGTTLLNCECRFLIYSPNKDWHLFVLFVNRTCPLKKIAFMPLMSYVDNLAGQYWEL